MSEDEIKLMERCVVKLEEVCTKLEDIEKRLRARERFEWVLVGVLGAPALAGIGALFTKVL